MPRKALEPEDRNLTARDKLLRDSFTPAEILLSGTLLLSTTIAFWFAQPRSPWVLGFFLIAGGFTPVLLKTHEHTHPFFVDLLWRRFWWLTIPVWWILAQSAIGISQNPIERIQINGAEYLNLAPVNIWRPSLVDLPEVWLPVLGFGSIYLVSINVFIIPKSRAFFEKVLPWLCTSAGLLAAAGLLQEAIGFQAPLFARGNDQSGYFAFFAYDGHWAAFALLWMVTCFAMGLLQLRYENSPVFLESKAPWYLTGATLLGLSGFFLEARLPSAVLLLTYTTMITIGIMNIAPARDEPMRKGIMILGSLLGILSLYGGIQRLLEDSADGPTMSALRGSAKEMFLDNPIFGWGMDSFSRLLPFYQPDWMLGSTHERAFSDFYQYLAEYGIIGALVAPVICIGLIIRYLKGKNDIHLTNHLLIGCLAIVILAFVDSPFMSPAVCLSFLLLFFSAMRWGDLSRLKVDEVDARVVVVTSEKERRVPVFEGEQKDKFN
ncbi:MAG: O-antigen ligase family protein [Coraliomargarita sp.]